MRNFELTQEHTKARIKKLRTLVMLVCPNLYNFLGNIYYTHTNTHTIYIYIYIYVCIVKPYIKGADDRCIFTHIHLQTAGWYIYTNLQLGEYIYIQCIEG